MPTTPKSTNRASVTALTSIYTVPAATTAIVLGIFIAERTSTATTVTVTYQNTASGVTTNLAFNVLLPANGTLLVLDANSRLVMQTGDILRVSAGTGVDVTMSYLEIT
jgi:hypothetical protein